MRELGVAAAQTVSIRGDVGANLEHHGRLAVRAAEEGADVVVFPELSLTGYELDIASTLAFTAEDERLQPLVDLAAARRIVLVVGAPVRLASGLHIGAFIIEPSRATSVYTKRYPFGDENAVFVPGDLDPLLPVGDDRAAFAICADTSHPEHAEAAAARGANLYLVGVVFTPEGYPTEAGRLADYAAHHGMAVAMANAGGPSTSFASAGRSSIWTESGDLVARLDGVGAGLVVARRSEHAWSGKTIEL